MRRAKKGSLLRTFLAAAFIVGCAENRPTAQTTATVVSSSAAVAAVVARVNALADDYVREYFEAFPELATVNDITSPRHDDRMGDNSVSALERWRAREDGWLAQVRGIDPVSLVGQPEWVTYGVLREQLEAGVQVRVCREELWSVRHELGWLDILPTLAAAQPVETPEARALALARWRDIGRFFEVEIAKLQQGLQLGYFAAKENVRRVVTLTDGLLTGPVEETLLFDPGKRAQDPEFSRQLAAVIAKDIRPALGHYRDFLEKQYLPIARDQIAVAAIPGGAACYRAYIRLGTGLDLDPEQVHQNGLAQVERIEREMREIAARSFGTTDLPALFARLTTEKSFLFSGGEERLRSAREAVQRAKLAVPRAFGLQPKTDVEVRPFDFEGSDFYQPSPRLGRPAIYWASIHNAEREPRLEIETTAFHEAIPGHHLQGSIARERGQRLHPIARYFWNNGYGEGLALYGERLAAELGLFSDDLSRLGMLSGQSFRAARLVVDSGIHAKGWSREQAIEYMLAHSAKSRVFVESEVDRYVGCPGQALGYMIGEIEIMALRQKAQVRLGSRFDLKDFHDRVLEDGQLTLPLLRAKIDRWLDQSSDPVAH